MAEKKKNQRTSRGSKKENIKAPSSKAAKKETEKSVVSQRAPEEKLIHQIHFSYSHTFGITRLLSDK